MKIEFSRRIFEKYIEFSTWYSFHDVTSKEVDIRLTLMPCSFVELQSWHWLYWLTSKFFQVFIRVSWCLSTPARLARGIVSVVKWPQNTHRHIYPFYYAVKPYGFILCGCNFISSAVNFHIGRQSGRGFEHPPTTCPEIKERVVV